MGDSEAPADTSNIAMQPLCRKARRYVAPPGLAFGNVKIIHIHHTSFEDRMDNDGAKVIQVIKTTLTRRGDGKSIDSPIRIVTQYWSLEGELLAEVDPCEKAQ